MSDPEINTRKPVAAKKKPAPKKRKAKAKVARGRSGVDLPQAQQEQGQVAPSREAQAHSSGAPTRVPMGNAMKLTVPPQFIEEGYYYYWFSDSRQGRLEQAQAASYQFVTDEQGNNYSRRSGSDTMYLMRLSQKHRDEDLKLKAERVAATLDAEASIGANEYAPDQKGRAEGGASAISRS